MLLIRSINPHLDPLDLHCANSARYPFILESVVHAGPHARYSIVFAFPGETVVLQPHDDGVDFLGELDKRWRQERELVDDRLELPFRGGWFVYLGYELVRQIEPSLGPMLPAASETLPIAFATRIPAAVIVDHIDRRAWLVAEAGRADLLDRMGEDVKSLTHGLSGLAKRCGARPEEDEPTGFLHSVGRIKEYIREGDVFQVNLSRGWRGQMADGVGAADLYRRLRLHNAAPFAGLALWGEGAIVSSSPERLVRVRGRIAETRPLAGTRPRAAMRFADRAFSSELLAHPKERAEHVMLIDLERNDLGRVCRPGSVVVDELMVLESYAHVHHIVSNVRGELRPDVTPGQVIRAVFPGGTITGCPKVRCMEIIGELERVGRGPYTGSMGYLNRDGSMDLNILIRTLVKDGSQLTLRAGAGIVADSVPEWELEETRAKARGPLMALADGAPSG